MGEFAEKLLSWYRVNRRILPWREEPTPYRVYVSEIMLQQTRVDTVVPYFERFMERFPDFPSLAAAEEGEVLLYWKGLGYYSRARNLRKSAQKVLDCYENELPRSLEELRKLPGVGEYVSHAVMAIGFNEKAIAVDGNLLRVYARLNALPIDVGSASAKRECEAYYLERIESPSEFNQALMDLGELVCLPHGTPRCDQCPFFSICKGKDNPERYPMPKKKPEAKKEDITVFILRDEQGRIAIRKREGTGLLEGMHELPNFPGKWDKKRIQKEFPSFKDVTSKGTKTHRFSHILWTMHVYEAVGVLEGYEYASLDEIKRRYSLPTAFAKLLY